MGNIPPNFEAAKNNADSLFAKLASIRPTLGPPVSLKEGETEWTRWFLYADSAMTKRIGGITLHWKP